MLSANSRKHRIDTIRLKLLKIAAKPSVLEELLQLKADVNLPVEFKLCDEEAMKVRSENGRLVQITKQIPPEEEEGEFIGIALFRKCVIPALRQKAKEVLSRGEYSAYFEAAIQELLNDNEFHVEAFDIKDAFWVEIDFRDDYDRAVKCMPEKMWTE